VPESGIIWPLTLASAHSRQTVAAVATLAAAFLATLYALGPLHWGVLLVVILAWFALPGVLLARWLYGSQPGGGAATLLAGPGWGYVLSTFGLLVLWASGVRSIAVLLGAPVLGLIFALPARRLAGAFRVPLFTRADLAACALVLLAVPVIVGRPFAHVGMDLPEGRAYRAYFTADFVWGVAVVAELAKGDMPPQNPYHLDDPLRYYWLMHLLPGVEHRAFGETPTADQLLLVNSFWSALVFSAFLYFFVRHFVAGPWAAALACIFVLFCSSFEGLERIWWHWSRNEEILPHLRMLNIDAVTGWIARYSGMKVDGLHRLLLYQPQHQTAYLLGVSAVLLVHQARDISRTALYAIVGVFLAAAMLVSSFVSLMLAGMAASYIAWRIVTERQWRVIVPGAIVAALPMAGALGLANLLGYVDTGGELIRFGLNSLATHNAAIVIFLNMGPVLVCAALGVILAARAGTLARLVPLAFMLAMCATFYFMLDLPDSNNSVGWHSTKVAFVVLTPLVGYAFQELWATPTLIRWVSVTAVGVIAIAALPTVAVDLYNTQDIWNRGRGPGYRWTVLLTPGELQGLEWIKTGTFKSARVQVEPIVRGNDTWAYIPAFAERRMSSGFPLSMIPLGKYRAANEKIKKLYQSTTIEDAHRLATGQCIDYLVIGPPERETYPQLEPLLDADKSRFVPAFRNGTLTVYYVPRDRGQAACQ
jgi:hypothetical protein